MAEQAAEGTVMHPSDTGNTAGKIDKKGRDGADPAWSDLDLDRDVRLLRQLVYSPRGLAGQDDQVVVFDQDLIAEFDAGLPGAPELLGKPGGGRNVHVEAACAVQVANQVLEGKLAGRRGVLIPPVPGLAVVSETPGVYRRVFVGQVPAPYAPQHVPLAEGEQGHCPDGCVPAKCGAVAKYPGSGLLQVSDEGGPLMKRRWQVKLTKGWQR